jgi:hypothetical protein
MLIQPLELGSAPDGAQMTQCAGVLSGYQEMLCYLSVCHTPDNDQPGIAGETVQ